MGNSKSKWTKLENRKLYIISELHVHVSQPQLCRRSWVRVPSEKQLAFFSQAPGEHTEHSVFVMDINNYFISKVVFASGSVLLILDFAPPE